jgi:hypothetical protein
MSRYDFYPDPGVDQLELGKAYWIKRDAQTPVTLAGEYEPSQYAPVSILIQPGFNQIGNPFLFAAYWGSLEIMYQGVTYTLDQAIAHGYIRPAMYWWVPGTVDTPAHYEWTTLLSAPLQPWEGYWIKSTVATTLTYQPPQGGYIFFDPSRATDPDKVWAADSRTAVPPPAGAWRAPIMASIGQTSRATAFFGADATAQNGCDALDIDAPPHLSRYVSAGFTHPDWGVNAGRYVQDIRGAGAQTWDLEVTTDVANADVTLTWPNLVQVPKDYRVMLVDVDGGRSRYMRTTGSYTFNSGAQAGTRRFQLVVEPASGAGLQITGLQCVPTRGRAVTITYNLSRDAMADVTVRTPAGKLIRVLDEARVSRAAGNTLSWDGKDGSGRAAPAGPYICEVRAFTEEGESVRNMKVFNLSR